QDCEAVSRALSDVLDEVDPIQDPYTFEVSSAGADRILKKPAHFQAFLGAEVDFKLYKSKDGQKDFSGILSAYEKDSTTFLIQAESVTVQNKELAQVRLHVSF
ncbi:MAG: ribosome maturation factor RimP, partial [Evtepia sp.]